MAQSQLWWWMVYYAVLTVLRTVYWNRKSKQPTHLRFNCTVSRQRSIQFTHIIYQMLANILVIYRITVCKNHLGILKWVWISFYTFFSILLYSVNLILKHLLHAFYYKQMITSCTLHTHTNEVKTNFIHLLRSFSLLFTRMR